MIKAFFLGCRVVGLGGIARAPGPVFSPARTQPGSFYYCKASDVRHSQIPNAADVQQPNKFTFRERKLALNTQGVSVKASFRPTMTETQRFVAQNFEHFSALCQVPYNVGYT